MTTRTTARCGIYESRPKLCRDYPLVSHWAPSECGFSFSGADREGSCDCGVSACCMVPRENGEPEGAPIPATAGGMPCKHVVWSDKEIPDEAEKVASVIDPEKLLMDAVSGE